MNASASARWNSRCGYCGFFARNVSINDWTSAGTASVSQYWMINSLAPLGRRRRPRLQSTSSGIGIVAVDIRRTIRISTYELVIPGSQIQHIEDGLIETD